MKRIVLTLCVIIAFSSLADAARFYRCVDRDGNTIMTDNPPPDATCEWKGAEKDLTPRERMQIENGQQQIERKREKELQEEQRRTELYNRIKKGMSQVEVRKILGVSFHSEVRGTGSGAVYREEWTYTESSGKDWIIKFWCGPKTSRVTSMERR